MRGDKNMGVFETIFRKPKADLKAEGYFKMLNGYTPVFSNAPESIYEMELTRAAIHSFASFASKLKPEISGTAQKNLERTLQFKPNPFMDTSKFIYRIATILSVNNTCFIVPIEDEFGGLIGYYPLLPQRCEVVEYNGAPFLRYTFGSGQKAAIEFERVGVMTQFQYTDDFFGEFIKLNISLVAGDVLTVSTGYGEKAVKLNRGGVITDAFRYLDVDSSYLQIAVGDNLFRYSADANAENLEVSIYHNNLYLGV